MSEIKSKKESTNQENSLDITNILPLKEKVILSGHKKLINTIKFDKYNQRMISGGNDYKLLFWDFQSMNKQLKPFRELEPMEHQIINQIDFDSSGQNLLVCGGSSKPKLLNKDGKEIIEFIKGDMYIKDLLYTKGHTSEVTDCQFQKNKDNICLTSSKDGSVRIWDLNVRPFGIERQLPCSTIIKCKKQNGQKLEVNKFLLSERQDMIIAFCENNNIQCFTKKSYYKRPILQYKKEGQNQFTSVCFDIDPIKFYTRGTDHTIKLFDLRKFTQPVQEFNNLRNDYFNTDMCLLNNRKYIITGLSYNKDENGKLVILDKDNGEIVYEEDIGRKNLGGICYNKKMNQLFCGIGENIIINYDKDKSKNGILPILQKEPKKLKSDQYQHDKVIYVPNALPMFKPDLKYRRKRFDKVRQDEVLTKKPEEMLKGPGFNGLISGPRTMIQNIMRTIHEVKGKRVDVIERAKKFAKQAEENPQFVESAYQFTQPKRILDYNVTQGKEQELMSMFKKCKHCGLKICQCYDYTKKQIIKIF